MAVTLDTAWNNYNVKTNGAAGDGTTDDTANIQACINAADATSDVTPVVYFPEGQYRISQLTLPAGVILQGVHSSAYGNSVNMDKPGWPVSVLEQIAGSNRHMILIQQGQNYQRIFDLGFDGNNGNNSAGSGIYIEDDLTGGQECQVIIDRCFVFNTADSGIYLGHNRRAVKVYNTTSNYSTNADGITVANSDSTIQNCILGSNSWNNSTGVGNGSGIRLGTTTATHFSAWSTRTDSTGTSTTLNSTTVNDTHAVAADLGKRITGTGIPTSTYICAVNAGVSYTITQKATATGNPTLTIGTAANAAAVTHVLGNDIYQNRVGITVGSGSWACLIQDNGMDRHGNEGITVYDGDANSIVGNAFHSNGDYMNNAFPHINIGASVTCVRIDGNVFGPQDGGVTNVASYGVLSNTGTANTIMGDLGTIDSTATVGGLVWATAGDCGFTTGKYTGWWTAPDSGLLAWAFDIANAANSSLVPTAGVLNLVRVHVPIACSVTNVLLQVTTAGAGLTSGQCFAALYNAAGTKIGATADQSGSWNSAGLKTMALASGPFTIPAGDYYVAFFYNGTTAPTLARGQNAGAAANSAVNLGSSTLRFATANTGLTTSMPATLGTVSSNNFAWWVGVS